MRDALRRNQKQSEAIRQVDCDLMRDALRRTQTQVRGNQNRMVPWGSAPLAISVGWYLGGELLFRLAPKEEHAVLLACMRHVMELAGRPGRLEIGDGCKTHDLPRGGVHEHVCL